MAGAAGEIVGDAPPRVALFFSAMMDFGLAEKALHVVGIAPPELAQQHELTVSQFSGTKPI